MLTTIKTGIARMMTVIKRALKTDLTTLLVVVLESISLLSFLKR